MLSYTSGYDQLLASFIREILPSFPSVRRQEWPAAGGTKESPAAGQDLTNVISITDFVEIFC